MKSDLPITDPKHPLQMNLSASQMHVKKWQNIAAECANEPAKARWARDNLTFHEDLAIIFKRLIEAEKGAA